MVGFPLWFCNFHYDEYYVAALYTQFLNICRGALVRILKTGYNAENWFLGATKFMSHPLEGMRVLDLTRLLPGATCTMMLVDLGADVIKVEDPNGGDYVRWSQPQIDGQSVFFRMNNRGKRAMIIDLKNAEGQAVLKRLVESADVLIEGFRPGVMARLNCDYESLQAINPRLVYCGLSGWGADGPYAQMGNHDLNSVSVAGLTGAMENPQVMGGQFADMGGSYLAVTGILAALLRRERTGEGGFVDASLSESALPFVLYNWTEALMTGTKGGQGALTGGQACYRVYRAKDGESVSLAALEPKFWSNFCHVIGREDLLDGYLEAEKQARLIAELNRVFAEKNADEWQAILGDVDCCFTVVKHPAEIADDPHYQARGLLGQFEDGTPWMRSPARISGSEPTIENVIPGYGEHTREVLLEADYDDDAIDALIAAGAVK
jgi:crotonobetainyl-CoA:carnitine CoA-transferase CaiB-like acyl-CoA transferase